MRTKISDTQQTADLCVRLVDMFSVLCEGDERKVSRSGKRLVAFLALRDAPVDRSLVCGELWGGIDDSRASKALRTAVWRLNSKIPGLVLSLGSALRLDPAAEIDLHTAQQLARSIINRDEEITMLPDDLLQSWISDLQSELLPGWYDDWVVNHQDRWTQLRLHALESLSDQARQRGRYPLAHEAALVAVGVDPLREGPHRCLIQAHLDEGNRADAIRHYEDYASMLRVQLGVAPSVLLADLMRTTTSTDRVIRGWRSEAAALDNPGWVQHQRRH